MRILSLLLPAALAVFGSACEKHPLNQPYGMDPHPGLHEEHAAEAHAEAHPEKNAEHTGAAKSAEGVKPEEAPKFFPEKK